MRSSNKVRRKFSVERNRRKLKKLSFFITPTLIIAVFVLGFYALFYKFHYFDIHNIEVVGTKSFVSKIDLLELAKSRSYEKNIFFINTQEFSTSLKKDFQGAKNIIIKKKYPNTLIIEVEERIPLALVHNEDKENLFLVDKDGYVLGQVAPETSNFPKIFYQGEIAVGYFLDKESIEMYFWVISATDSLKLTVNAASIYDNYLIMIVEDDVEVLLGKDKDIQDSMDALATLMLQLKSQSKDVAKIDLRYDKVIVSYR